MCSTASGDLLNREIFEEGLNVISSSHVGSVSSRKADIGIIRKSASKEKQPMIITNYVINV